MTESTDGLDDLLRMAAVWQEVPRDLEARVLREAGVATAPAPAVVPRPRRVANAGRIRWTERFRPLLTAPRLALAAAGVVAVAAIGALGVATLRPAPGTTARTALNATPLAPGSHADVKLRNTPSGVEIDLDVAGLPPAADGQFYAAWVKGDRGLVPIGTFHLRQGTKDVVLWSGVDLKDYRTISVTLQQEGAGPGSSGRVLMKGEVPATFD
jgi:hypothetical protein